MSVDSTYEVSGCERKGSDAIQEEAEPWQSNRAFSCISEQWFVTQPRLRQTPRLTAEEFLLSSAGPVNWTC